MLVGNHERVLGQPESALKYSIAFRNETVINNSTMKQYGTLRSQSFTKPDAEATSLMTDSEKLKVLKNELQQMDKNSKSGGCCYVETPSYTFTLPNFDDHEEDFRKFLEKDLIEASALKTLENSGHLNWWIESGLCQRLWPLATKGDGNCLLHAASLAMWGFHDRLLVLRKALHSILTNGSRRHALWRRWRWQQTHQNNQSGLIFSEEEWKNEWDNVIRLSSPEPRSKPTSSDPLNRLTRSPERNVVRPSNNVGSDADDSSSVDADALYESLEEVHVFALAHVLKRPIVVIADTVLKGLSGEAFAPILFGGIYLPLECCPSECHRSPLLLCYDAAHFSALVPMQAASASNDGSAYPIAAVPVTYKLRDLLPLHFCCDPGPDFTWWVDSADEKISTNAALTSDQKLELLAKYVDLIKLNKKFEPVELSSAAFAVEAPIFPSSVSCEAPLLNSQIAGGDCQINISGCRDDCRHKNGENDQASDCHPQLGSHDCQLSIDCQPLAVVVHRSESRHAAPSASTLPATFSDSRRRGSTGSLFDKRMISSAAGLNRWQRTARYLNATTRATWLRLKRSIKKRVTSRGRQRSLMPAAGRALTLPRLTGNASSLLSNLSVKNSVSLSDLRDHSSLIAARLRTDTHHRFMEEMIANYLKTARRRFNAERQRRPNDVSAAATQSVESQNGKIGQIPSNDNVKIVAANGDDVIDGTGANNSAAGEVRDSRDDVIAERGSDAKRSDVVKNDDEIVGRRVDVNGVVAAVVVGGGGRERFSRSFSASSINVKCMNGKCESRATHRTNFLCGECYDKQRKMMQSFSTHRGQTTKRDFPADNEKSANACLIVAPSSTHRESPLYDVSERRACARRIARSTFYVSLAYGNHSTSSSAPSATTPIMNAAQSPTMASAVVACGGGPPSVTIVRPCRSIGNCVNDASVADSASTVDATLSSSTTTRTTVTMTSSFGNATVTSPAANSLAAAAPPTAYRAVETTYNAAQVFGPDGDVLLTQYYVTPAANDDVTGRRDGCAATLCVGYESRATDLCTACAATKRKLAEATANSSLR